VQRLKKVERVGETIVVCGGTTCQLETHIKRKSGKFQTTFCGPQSYPKLTSGRPTVIPPTLVPPLLLSPLFVTSPTPLSLSLHLNSHCVAPTTSSQPPCFLLMAIAQPNSLPIMSSPSLDPHPQLLPSHPYKHPTQLQVAGCRGYHVSWVQF
jgi:hypothetical protein